MRLRGCVAERRKSGGTGGYGGDAFVKARERNAEAMWRVCLSTGRLALPETIDARRGIVEV
jgi:hypothetical protein